MVIAHETLDQFPIDQPPLEFSRQNAPMNPTGWVDFDVPAGTFVESKEPNRRISVPEWINTRWDADVSKPGGKGKKKLKIYNVTAHEIH